MGIDGALVVMVFTSCPGPWSAILFFLFYSLVINAASFGFHLNSTLWCLRTFGFLHEIFLPTRIVLEIFACATGKRSVFRSFIASPRFPLDGLLIDLHQLRFLPTKS